MRPYHQLSFAGKLRRLHGLAAGALASYDLKAPAIAYHAFETNLLFRTTTASGERFMLRLASPGWRDLEDLQAEALWVNALARDTAIPVPAILPARSGEHVLALSSPGVPKTWYATLMRWVPGRLLGRYLTEHNLAKMGALFAALHHHSAEWEPPAGFTTRRFEHWLSRDEPNRITGNGAAGAAPEDGLRQDQAAGLELLERMDRRVEAAYAAIDRRDLRVIHCDLWHDNIKLHRGVLHPLDFEDTVWGFRAHDIAMAMLDLLETVGESRYPALLAAFRRGYTAHLPWPDDPLEPFQVGRLLWKINWVATFQPQHLENMVARHAPVLAHFEQTGEIILPAPG